MFSVRAFKDGDARTDISNLRQNHLKRWRCSSSSPALNKIPLFSLPGCCSKRASPSSVNTCESSVISAENWQQEKQLQMFVLFSTLQRQACKWWAMEEKRRLSARGGFFTIDHRHSGVCSVSYLFRFYSRQMSINQSLSNAWHHGPEDSILVWHSIQFSPIQFNSIPFFSSKPAVFNSGGSVEWWIFFFFLTLTTVEQWETVVSHFHSLYLACTS